MYFCLFRNFFLFNGSFRFRELNELENWNYIICICILIIIIMQPNISYTIIQIRDAEYDTTQNLRAVSAHFHRYFQIQGPDRRAGRFKIPALRGCAPPRLGAAGWRHRRDASARRRPAGTRNSHKRSRTAKS